MTPPRSQKTSAGFTLLEIMLVIVLVSVASAGVMMTMPSSGDGDELEKFARRFAAQVRFVQEKAVLTTDEFGIVADENGYMFVTLEEDNWKRVEEERVIAEQEFEAPFAMILEVGALVPEEEDTLEFKGLSFKEFDGLTEENFLETDEDKEKIDPPQIMLMASGESTAFSVAFVSDNTEDAWWVTGDELGNLTVEAGTAP